MFNFLILSTKCLIHLLATDGGMKRLGLRSSLLSTETKVGAGTKATQTTAPQLFYDRVLCPVID